MSADCKARAAERAFAQPSVIATLAPLPTSSSESSLQRLRTNAGSPTSRTYRRMPGFSFLRLCWTHLAGALWGGQRVPTCAQLVLDALNMAIHRRKPVNVVHHSDQGTQYTSIAFGSRCREANVRPSMGSVGDLR